MNIIRSLLPMAFVLAACAPKFTQGAPPDVMRKLITPPISVPKPDPSTFVQCAATNVSDETLEVTIQILNQSAQVIESAVKQLDPLSSTTIFKFNPAGGPFICKYTYSGGKDSILGTLQACSFTGVGGEIFNCAISTADKTI